MKKPIRIPERGRTAANLLEELKERKAADLDWRGGRNFAYVYYAGQETLDAIQAAYQLFFSENALNPSAFPSLRNMERECVQMIANLLGGQDSACGSLTSGGTESILMAVKSAKSWAAKNRPEIKNPEIVLSETAHPAFHKACHYFGLKARVIPSNSDHRADIHGFREAIGPQTILLVASAPAYPHGLLDPVEAIAALAQEQDLLCHVDACVGGFMLPFLQLEGYDIPAFDFSLPGVTSISADIHKYGYAAKGASVILYREPALHKAQFYVYTDWPGGIYASPSVQGTRPGGAIAGAWMALHFLGLEGYRKLARQTMETALRFREQIGQIDGIEVIGEPEMSIFALRGTAVDIFDVGDEMTRRGWYMDRQQLPPSLHFTITPAHRELVDQWAEDLKVSVQAARKVSLHKLGKQTQVGLLKGLKKVLPTPVMQRLQRWAGSKMPVNSGGRQAAMYGMLGELQGEESLPEMVENLLFRMINEE